VSSPGQATEPALGSGPQSSAPGEQSQTWLSAQFWLQGAEDASGIQPGHLEIARPYAVKGKAAVGKGGFFFFCFVLVK